MSTLPTTTPVSGNISALVSNTAMSFVRRNYTQKSPFHCSHPSPRHCIQWTQMDSTNWVICNVDELVIDEVAVIQVPSWYIKARHKTKCSIQICCCCRINEFFIGFGLCVLSTNESVGHGYHHRCVIAVAVPPYPSVTVDSQTKVSLVEQVSMTVATVDRTNHRIVDSPRHCWIERLSISIRCSHCTLHQRICIHWRCGNERRQYWVSIVNRYSGRIRGCCSCRIRYRHRTSDRIRWIYGERSQVYRIGISNHSTIQFPSIIWNQCLVGVSHGRRTHNVSSLYTLEDSVMITLETVGAVLLMVDAEPANPVAEPSDGVAYTVQVSPC